MFTRTFWKDAGERAIRTFAQTLGSILITLGVGIGVFDVDWQGAVSAAALSGVISLLMSIGGIAAGDKGSASLVELER